MADIVDLKSRMTTKGGGDDKAASIIYCVSCGSRAFRLNATKDHTPASVQCYNCNDTFETLAWVKLDEVALDDPTPDGNV